MSNAPREARSFEKIDNAVLHRLADIAIGKLDDAFSRRPEMGSSYRAHLLGICLCQGAADHLLHPDPSSGNGVQDFDLWAFYPNIGMKSFWNRRPSTADFGPSVFDRNPLDGDKYTGRRVDVLWRTIDMQAGQTDTEAIRSYFAVPRSSSARELRKKSAVLVWPKVDVGAVIWPPPHLGAASST